ncbi:MAG: hypothetical protein KDA74_20770 [Planctomycetaceae bacterium]|nr:hypothetical protein [Planctomycetaceae bacterium]
MQFDNCLYSLNRLLVLLALLLVPCGCGQQSEPGHLDAALELQAAGKTDEAIEMLSEEDIEKAIQASSLRTLKMSETQFKSQFRWGRKHSQEELVYLVPLIKQAAFIQIEQLQAAEEAGLSAKSKLYREQLQRLIQDLQDKNRVLIYQQLGKVIKRKLDQVSTEEEVSEAEL